MLIAMGIALLLLGAWFAGAIYAAADPPHIPRLIVGYGCSVVFIGIGVILITGI